MGSHKDRHECIGKGNIGIDTLYKFIQYADKKNIPVILETPNNLQGFKNEIKLLRNYKSDSDIVL